MTTQHSLYVAWQDPDGRSWYPVAQVAFDDEEYSFQYLEGAKEAANAPGFPGIAQFPDLHILYRSKKIFPFLKNRVLSRSRGDFNVHAGRLGLDVSPVAHSLHAFELLERSNGRRATDRFELFASPQIQDDLATFVFFLRGVRHLPETVQQYWEESDPRRPLRVFEEPGNVFDPNALLISSAALMPMGFVPRYYSRALTELLQLSPTCAIRVIQRNPSPAPSRERFLVEVQIHVPPNWMFSDTPQFTLIEPREVVSAGIPIQASA